MFIIHVQVHVKAGDAQPFIEATLENARESLKEPGITRFDILQHLEDPNRFTLVEAYRTSEDPARHKETPHYQVWRDKVESMMAEPRSSIKFANIFPDDDRWGSP